MKKYGVLVLAVMLVGMSSCAWALLDVRPQIDVEKCYVGGKERSLALIVPYGNSEFTYTFYKSGAMPPGCELKNLDGLAAEIYGVPTRAGVYTITVYAHGRAAIRGNLVTDDGSTTFTLTIRNDDNNNDDNNNGNNNNDDNNNGNNNNDDNNNNNNNNNNGNTGKTSSSGGGCNSLPTLAIILATAFTFRKSRT